MILERDKLAKLATHFPFCASEALDQAPHPETVVFFTDDDRQVLLRTYVPVSQPIVAE